MLTYRRLERAVWALLVAYVLAGMYQQLVMATDRDRLFPLNSWALFSKVPAEVTDYGVRLLELNGERITAPNFVERGGPRPALATVEAYGLIQKLGRALGNDDRHSVGRARRALEGIYLSGAEPFRYEVVRRRYDPIERWGGGALRAAETVGQFDSRANP